VPPDHRVRLIFIADAALHTQGKKGHLYGPGDLLTLRLFPLIRGATSSDARQIVAEYLAG
jgi:hypothetical protein